MKNLEKQKNKKSNGITLIALVITIIVLLILAGVTIATLTGDNGILTRANEAKERTEQAEKDEKTELARTEDLINEYVNGIEVEQVTDENPGVLETEGADTYIINSIEDLVFFAYDVTNGNTYEGKTVKLGLSLDFNSTKSYVDPLRTDYGEYGYNGELKTLLTSGGGFIPIGTTSSTSRENSFAGTFDGNGKLISNLYINISSEDNSNELLIGLFGVNYGKIKGLGLVNCSNSGTLSTTGNNTVLVAGVTGMNYGEINSSFVSGTLCSNGKNNAKSRSGGIAGSANNATIKNCYSMGNIKGIGNFVTCVGGIVGTTQEGLKIENCYNVASLTVDTTNGTQSIGGIVGHAIGIIINNTYNIEELNLQGSATDTYAGGIVGYNHGGNINNCHNRGEINENTITTGAFYIGQIASNNVNGVIKNSYYLVSEKYDGVGINGGTNESIEIQNESQMPNILDVIGNSFKDASLRYPVLNWQ